MTSSWGHNAMRPDCGPLPGETHLGDAVYADTDTDGYMIRLVANKGGPNEQTVWLEPSVYAALTRYAEKVWRPARTDI